MRLCNALSATLSEGSSGRDCINNGNWPSAAHFSSTGGGSRANGARGGFLDVGVSGVEDIVDELRLKNQLIYCINACSRVRCRSQRQWAVQLQGRGAFSR